MSTPTSRIGEKLELSGNNYVSTSYYFYTRGLPENCYKSGREAIISCSIEYVSRTEIKLIKCTEIEEILVCFDDNIIASNYFPIQNFWVSAMNWESPM